jgi:hypothetical protein
LQGAREERGEDARAVHGEGEEGAWLCAPPDYAEALESAPAYLPPRHASPGSATDPIVIGIKSSRNLPGKASGLAGVAAGTGKPGRNAARTHAPFTARARKALGFARRPINGSDRDRDQELAQLAREGERTGRGGGLQGGGARGRPTLGETLAHLRGQTPDLAVPRPFEFTAPSSPTTSWPYSLATGARVRNAGENQLQSPCVVVGIALGSRFGFAPPTLGETLAHLRGQTPDLAVPRPFEFTAPSSPTTRLQRARESGTRARTNCNRRAS